MKEYINKELLRLAVITILIAGIFGILQYFPEGKTFASLEMGVILKVVALTMLYAAFPIFALYLLFLGINLRYEKGKKYPNAQSFFYDLGIFITTFIIVLSLLIFFLIWILVKFPIVPMWIITSIIWIVLIFSAIIIGKKIHKIFKNRLPKLLNMPTQERINSWVSFIWTFIIYILYLITYIGIIKKNFDGISLFITAWVIILFIGEIFTSYMPKEQRLDFELKFYTPIIIGIFAGVVSALYNAEQITNLWQHIIILVTMILMYGGFIFIEYKKRNQ